MSLRRRGMMRNILKWVGLILLGIIVGIGSSFGYWYWNQSIIEKTPPIIRQEIITVNREIEIGHVLTEADLAKIEMDEASLPQGFYSQPEEVIGRKAWVKLVPKVVLREDCFYQTASEYMENEQEIVLSKVPEDLEVGDYIDVRIHFPSGHDYCVLSHKQVGNLWQEKNMVMLGLNEEERVRFGSAQTDVQTYQTAYLYLSIYPKAVDVADTIVRYPVNGSVQKLYEDVKKEKVMGDERNRLEIALNQLKMEEKFLKAESTSAGEKKDNNQLNTTPTSAEVEKKLESKTNESETNKASEQVDSGNY